MKTKFILHGGMLSVPNSHNDSFFKEITKDLADNDKVLFIGFARIDEKQRQEIYERDKEYILAQTEKDIIVENAKLETVIEQANEAKAIFVTGGTTQWLQSDLEKYPRFRKAINGKVYAGSSAGACICSTYYFGCTPAKVLKGMGFLPIRLMVHYGNSEYNSTDETLAELKKYPEELELVVLPECKWVVKEIEL